MIIGPDLSLSATSTAKCLITVLFHIKVAYSIYFLLSSQHSLRLSGGLVLWSRSFTPDAEHLASSSASPVNSLIREALIEGRTTEQQYEKDGYAVKWSFVNDLELVFVVSSIPSHHRCAHLKLKQHFRRLPISVSSNSHTLTTF